MFLLIKMSQLTWWIVVLLRVASVIFVPIVERRIENRLNAGGKTKSGTAMALCIYCIETVEGTKMTLGLLYRATLPLYCAPWLDYWPKSLSRRRRRPIRRKVFFIFISPFSLLPLFPPFLSFFPSFSLSLNLHVCMCALIFAFGALF